MNTKSIEKNWNEIRGKIKTQWEKFTDEDLESFKSGLEHLSDKVQKTYGVAKEQAEQQYNEFAKTIHDLVTEEKVKPVIRIVAEPSKAAAATAELG